MLNSLYSVVCLDSDAYSEMIVSHEIQRAGVQNNRKCVTVDKRTDILVRGPLDENITNVQYRKATFPSFPLPDPISSLPR